MITAGLAAGALTVLICTSEAFAWIRKWAEQYWLLDMLLSCTFCTSVWVSLPFASNFTTWWAIVALANVTVLLIHLSLATTSSSTV